MRPLGKRLKTVLALVLVAAVLVFIIWPAIHNFVKFGLRSRMAEARTNLKALCIAQVARIKDHGEGTAKYRELPAVGEGNRYAYFVAPGPVLEVRPVRQGLAHPVPVVPNLEATGVQVDTDRYGTKSVERAVDQGDLPQKFLGGLVLGQKRDLS